ncbi:hypothetical protein FIV06_09215 [Labrenzia sp. THAF191b]|uniref:PDC sensor domain-containing protein n=1 Tax=unclassified Labrenzia TaxID=2648686 RepID=UPI0012A962DF|nr:MULTISPECIES: hypothetical protein [unclassified Labrenzia]QFS97600.1 hypothetical protein FIV06_09215 [Labrenzia sp. THAF191b]QFT03915.1 hypothetical protein FIV05_09215 [Labrenzia sp. THAF191a]QFT15457.1 hypothetical protein FIV03_09220 [Labrenzia sp. THAF187b]
MVRIFSTLVFAITFATSAIAQIDIKKSETEYLISEVVQSARTNQLAAERILYAAEQAIDAGAVIVSSVQNDRLVHTELKRLATGVPGARAIIVIGSDGQLLHDSYKYPVAPLDLSDRSYFKEALTGTDLVVGKQVVGRTSGASFVPLVKRLGSLTFVVVASPFALVDLQSECGDCWSLALQRDGTIVTMFPPEIQVSSRLINVAISAHETSGSRVVRYQNSVVAVAWRKSSDFPLINLSVRGLPDTATVDIDIN